MENRLYAAEFVFPGHPDKLSDAIADALVAEAIRREPRALVGVEIAVHRNRVFVTGRIACHDAEGIDVENIVRGIYSSAGYGDNWQPSADEVVVQSELCLGPLEEGEAEYRELSDDQAICIGYANDLPQTNHLPVEHWLVRRLAQLLYGLRADNPGLLLGPDGKVLVVLREDGRTWALDGFSCSLQQREATGDVALHRAVRLLLEEELADLTKALPGLIPALPEQLTVNGCGAFDVGGPEGDNGLSGKKLVMDAYGPRVPIGGGAWSGKDFFKADRAGGLHARRLAKLIVELGLASEATVTLGWYPGDREARVLDIATADGGSASVGNVSKLIDLTLKASGTRFGQDLDLADIARWGHFVEPELPWEGFGHV
jgi:S-adenosylmethionine synthetase